MPNPQGSFAAPFALLLGVGAIASAADDFGEPINVQIDNATDTDRTVEVIDNICQRRALAQVIEAGSWVAVQLCTRSMQGGDATVRDGLTGAEQRYQQVRDGMDLQAP